MYEHTIYITSKKSPQVKFDLPGTASPRTGTWQSANNKAIQEFLKRHSALSRGPFEALEWLWKYQFFFSDGW